MKIVSGGQTGVDLAALEFALDHGILHGGWVPKGRTNEAGGIPLRFDNLTETKTRDVSERTKLNVRSSDATLIFVDGSISPGTQLTIEFAAEIGRPHLVVDVRDGVDSCARRVSVWMKSVPIGTLNVAGPRASEAPKIGTRVRAILQRSLDTDTDK